MVIPFSALELGVASSLTSLIKPGVSLPFPKEHILQKAQVSLTPKKDHLVKLFARLGLTAKQLENKELIKLFYEIYNGESLKQPL